MPLPAPSLCEPVSFPAPLPFFLVNNSSFSSYPDPQLLSFSLSPFSGTRGISLLVQGWGAWPSALGMEARQTKIHMHGRWRQPRLPCSPCSGMMLGSGSS